MAGDWIRPEKRGNNIHKFMQIEAEEELEGWKNVVYPIDSKTCELHYIGKSGHHCCDKSDQHKRDVKQRQSSNDLCDHINNTEGHEINWGMICFLG